MASAPWVETFHSLGLEPEILAPMQAEVFMDLARRKSGLDDFGEPHFMRPLQVVLDSIGNSRMSLLGKMIKLEEVLRYLVGRLRIEEELKRDPSILEEEIEKPIFIVSLPRAGSSILFELMSQRQGVRYPLHFEAVEPTPPPHPDTYRTDPRIESMEDWIESWNRIAPDFPSRHLVGPTVPVECLTLMGYSFASAQFVYGVRRSDYMPHITSEDWVLSYRYYRRVLQILQKNFPNKQWLLKSPPHLYMLGELLTVFPDAQIVFIHRDPITVLASLGSVMDTVNRGVFGEPFDPADYLVNQYMVEMEPLLGHMMDVYDKALSQGGKAVNALYADLMADPVGEVARIYEEIGIGMTEADLGAIARYLDERPKHKHGKHSYTIPDVIDVDAFRERSAGYMRKFGVPEE